MDSQEYTIEEEEVYIIGNFLTGTVVNSEFKGSYSIIGFEEGLPLIQINDETFIGEIDSSLGSSMIFKVAKEEGKKTLKHVANTSRVINFTGVRLKK
ncbi:hypothetical protein BB560_000980 [Smittium megazygosporum]|uniref:Transcription factor TFIIIC triple barrel domain-containing protein n=1 Tax=Smittium megazygosporum TaxID=133381 RepID=A0A2T9ZIX4_9FUNG|nr:hypothetical protein BB560_000980 [Smittium megazygosporum]